ncbi:glycine cleavage system T protein [Candidatus Endolissoclinum faulkneri L2]|uniref:aminomethyltransferase n=1 Tax=Candidatus Endolissoclinum faulkneri L2 TaxID=1193729 RepID=K7YF72_9PROT|nr:glycine cleavage system aminomethyltransferase GcvT [Candidatus Endolissoclinum faulkneri]AFX98225.1 glycine cleavage system T protein [Candidatus Endolissoclinum faulkneri L2]
MSDAKLKTTPLNHLHRELGATMVAFVDYDMPMQFPLGVLKEHRHTRAKAGLFDVSHMGQVQIYGKDRAKIFETLVPGNIRGLNRGCMRYTQFTNSNGGILDDLIITNAVDHLFVVVNAACKEQDIAIMESAFGEGLKILDNRALLALQGPIAVNVLVNLAPKAANLTFMTGASMDVGGFHCFVTRSGYTGEDGYEISVPAENAECLARELLNYTEVEAIGLGARDSLRLEAGLCLYGQDIDISTSPVEASLLWSIGKHRRKNADFPGASRIQKEIIEGTLRQRVGIKTKGPALARRGCKILDENGNIIGKITSGCFGPSVQSPVAMGYVVREYAAANTVVFLMIRDNLVPANIVKLPFITPGYKR